MPRISIQQFRAALASGSEQGTLLRTYRRLTRRADVAAGMLHADWAVWPPAVASATRA